MLNDLAEAMKALDGKKRAISLCCHETKDGGMTKHNHTPSTKAEQLSRHSCNQIPRGRTNVIKMSFSVSNSVAATAIVRFDRESTSLRSVDYSSDTETAALLS